MDQQQQPRPGCMFALSIIIPLGLALMLGEALLKAMIGRYGTGGAVAAWCGIAVALGLCWEQMHLRSRKAKSGHELRYKSRFVLDEAYVDAIESELDLERRRRDSVLKELGRLKADESAETSYALSERRRLEAKRLEHDKRIDRMRNEIRRRAAG